MHLDTPYRILLENRAGDGWTQLNLDHPAELAECLQFLKMHPTNLRATQGKAKKLKGQLKDYYQYDVTYDDRVRYQVDKKAREVKIAYAGGHP